MAKLELAVAGAGLIGRAHIALICKSQACKLAAIADPTPQAEAFARELGVAHFAELEQMLDEAKPQGVIVATPNAAACRERPVLCRPRRSRADREADHRNRRERAQTGRCGQKSRCAAACRSSSPPQRNLRAGAGCDPQRQARPDHVGDGFTTFLKPDPYFDMTWRREPGGGPVLINLIHDIDDLRFLIGDITRLQAMTSNAIRGFKVEDGAVVNLQFENGALGSISCSDAAAAPWSWELTSGENSAFPRQREDCCFISGTEARSRCRPCGCGITALSAAGPRRCIRRSFRKMKPTHSHVSSIISARLSAAKAEPVCSGEEGAKTLQVTLAIHELAAARREVG